MNTNKSTDEKTRLNRILKNLNEGKYFKKGIHDSTTEYIVLASSSGNYFGPYTCYYDYVEALKPGVYYIDSEKEYRQPNQSSH